MHSYLIIAVVVVTTAFIRFLPFLFFRERVPDRIVRLGKILPSCAMAMLVVFCLRNIRFDQVGNFAPEIIASLLAVLLYKWKHSAALAIVLSTSAYMWMIQKLF